MPRTATKTAVLDVKRLFLDGQIDVLLCTDAAAEGLNLQTADLLINYDMPWNPTKVEQRIGRIDRIGQRHDNVYVLNLCYVGSVEHEVYVRLAQRLQGIGGVVGAQQSVLLPILPEEFEALASGETTLAALEATLRERMETMRAQSAAMELPPEEMYEVYQALRREYDRTALPVTLDGIWRVLAHSEYLAALGCRSVTTEHGEALQMANVPGVRDGDLLTVSRVLFERGSRELGGTVHFASYGVPAFEAVLDAVLRHERPEVEVLAQPVAGTGAQVVALAVRHAGTIKAVQALADVDGPSQSGDGTGADEVADQLRDYAQQLERTLRVAEETERQGARIGKTHQALVLAAAASLIDEAGVAQETQYLTALNSLHDTYADREQVYLSRLPAGLLQHQVLLTGALAPSPTDSNFCRWAMPRAQLDLVLGAAGREGRGLKKKGGQIPVEQLLRRLNDRARVALRELQ